MVALDVDGLFGPLREQVAVMVARGLVRPPAVQALQWAGSVAEALDLVEAGLQEPRTFAPLAEEALEFEP